MTDSVGMANQMSCPVDDSEVALIAIMIAMHKLKLPHGHPEVLAEMNRLVDEYDRGMAALKLEHPNA